MKQKPNDYNFIKDPHLAYFMQSPYKIAQLLKTRRYKIKGTQLIEIGTNDAIDIDPYVLKRLDLEQVERVTEFDNLNQKVKELIQNGCNAQQKFQQFKKSNIHLSQKVQHSPSNLKKNHKTSKNSMTLPHIKGLKEFQMKIL